MAENSATKHDESQFELGASRWQILIAPQHNGGIG